MASNLEMTAVVEKRLTCPSCSELFSNERPPKRLPCGEDHLICDRCLGSLLQTVPTKCPVDQEVINRTEGKAESDFPTDQNTLRLVNFLKPRPAATNPVCPVCMKTLPLQKCSRCSYQLCEECCEVHEAKHELMEIKRDLQGKMALRKIQLQNHENTLRQQIRQDTNRLVQKVKEREQKLKQDLDEYFELATAEKERTKQEAAAFVTAFQEGVGMDDEDAMREQVRKGEELLQKLRQPSPNVTYTSLTHDVERQFHLGTIEVESQPIEDKIGEIKKTVTSRGIAETEGTREEAPQGSCNPST